MFVCFQELTGCLPPEIPLAPGEDPPQIPRRVGTAFSLDTDFIGKDNEVRTKRCKQFSVKSVKLSVKIM